MTARAGNGRGAQTPAARRAAAGLAAPFEPMVFAKRDRKAEAAAAKNVPQLGLFEVDGTVYTVPAEIPTGRRLELLLVSVGMATEPLKCSYLIRELAGPAALQALLADADYREADLLKLGANLSKHVFGALEAASGN